jgi:hypothetical protein
MSGNLEARVKVLEDLVQAIQRVLVAPPTMPTPQPQPTASVPASDPKKCPVPGCSNWKKPEFPTCYQCMKDGKKAP